MTTNDFEYEISIMLFVRLTPQALKLGFHLITENKLKVTQENTKPVRYDSNGSGKGNLCKGPIIHDPKPLVVDNSG